MIGRCADPRCDGLVELGHVDPSNWYHIVYESPCTVCGKLTKWTWKWESNNTVRGRRGLRFPRYKPGTKFGQVVAVPTGYSHRTHTRKQRKRLVSRYKRYRWRTKWPKEKGRIPKG